jgi:hypothetical protein
LIAVFLLGAELAFALVQHHCQAIRRYVLLQQGDFAAALVDALRDDVRDGG